MPLETINNGDSGLVARQKINAAIDAINAMTSTTTSTSTTTTPTTTSSTTSTTTTSTTTQPTTTSSTTTQPTEYNYMISNCAGGSSYTITTSMFLSSANVYKFFAPSAPYDTNACWTVTPSGTGGTFSTIMNTFGSCIECTTGTTSSTTTSSTSTTTYTPPPTTTSTTTIP